MKKLIDQYINYKLCLAVFSIILLTGCTGSPGQWSNLTIDQLLKYFNTNSALPLIGFVKFIGYVIGVIFFFKGFMKLKSYGDYRNMMSSQAEAGKAILYLAAALALINIDQAMDIFTMSIWGMNSNAVDVKAASFFTDPNLKNVIDSLNLIIRLVGIIAFVRGWILLVGAATHNGQQGGIPKALTHMIGGILLFHFEAVAVLLGSAFGLVK